MPLLCIVSFNGAYVRYIRDGTYKKALQNGHADIDSIIKGKGLNIIARIGDCGDYKYGSSKQIYRAANSIKNNTKPTIREFKDIVTKDAYICATDEYIINLYNFIDGGGWSDRYYLKYPDFTWFVKRRIKEYKRIYGSK